MTKKPGWIRKEDRKKILLLSDDMRMTSGVGVMSKEIVIKTAHHYNWVQLAAAVKHPEQGKLLDMSDAVNKETGLDDSLVRLYPCTGYGNQEGLRYLLMNEKPDAILHFTDPRFWIWLYQMEHEIREHLPIFFYHIWDDTPYPKYNENFYRSCDWIGCISKQTYNIVKQVWQKGGKDNVEDWRISYVPHGIDPNVFRPLDSKSEKKDILEWRKKLLGNDEVDFIIFWNNLNIRRKMPGDLILAFQYFLKQLPKEKANRCRMVLHTQPVDENGTDLPVIIRDIAPECKIIFSVERLTPQYLNMLYNLADVTINIASNEGVGMGTLESMAAETPIIVNVTGGLQDQCGFMTKAGVYLDPDEHFNFDFGTNADKKYTKHGDWVLPVWPAQRGLIGSPQTPYIFDDRCDWKDVGMQLLKFYNMSPAERKRRGMLGREYAIKEGYTSEGMAQCFIDGMDRVFEKWDGGCRPPRHTLIKAV